MPGVGNLVADALSRPPAGAAVVLPASTGLLNWAQLAMAQTLCQDLAVLRAKRLHLLVAVHVHKGTLQYIKLLNPISALCHK